MKQRETQIQEEIEEGPLGVEDNEEEEVEVESKEEVGKVSRSNFHQLSIITGHRVTLLWPVTPRINVNKQ